MKNDWHGWGTIMSADEGEVSLHIGPVPERKQIALYITKNKESTWIPLAYFRDKKSARQALKFIDCITGCGPNRYEP